MGVATKDQLMVEFSAFRRSLVALALCSAAIAVSASPASARSRHGAYRHAHARHAFHHVRRHFAQRLERSTALLRRFAQTQASVTPYEPGGGVDTTGSSSSLVMEARHYLGTNPTSRASLWCARFTNMVLERTGHHGTGSDMANSFAHYGH